MSQRLHLTLDPHLCAKVRGIAASAAMRPATVIEAALAEFFRRHQFSADHPNWPGEIQAIRRQARLDN